MDRYMPKVRPNWQSTRRVLMLPLHTHTSDRQTARRERPIRRNCTWGNRTQPLVFGKTDTYAEKETLRLGSRGTY